MSVILATQEAEIRMIMVQSQPRKTVSQTHLKKKKKKSQKKADEMAQVVGLEFKLQYCQKKKIHKINQKITMKCNYFEI
jgi:hypothetical protein